MATLTELSSKEHKDLKVSPGVQIKYASKQHVMPLSAAEISNAATCFPVFVTRNNVNGSLVFSAMTSFELEQNLFVQDDNWAPVFQPNSLRTYPFYLMQSEKSEQQFTIGFDAQSNDLSPLEGTILFDEQGKASQYLTQVTRILESELGAIKQSLEFGKALEEFKLLRVMDLHVQYENGQTHTITGLHTINEEAMQLLSAEQLSTLNKAGYLMPIHALLMSLFNLNALITKNNALAHKAKVSSIKMEVSKDFTHA